MKFLVILFLLPLLAFSLEVDSKLTLRVVKVSSSQKTILINRGVEDGLVKNNHAKFYVSTGVVARGVVVKVSPTRSVWSLYRIVNNNYIVKDQVLKLKITTELKVTKDESRSLVSDDQSFVTNRNPRDLGIPLAEGADDVKGLEVSDLTKDVEELESTNTSRIVRSSSKRIELGASGTYEANSSVTSSENTEFSGADNKVNLNLFLEYYLNSLDGKLGNLSLRFIYGLNNSNTISYEGTTTKEAINEYGGGLSYHFKSTKDVSIINPFLDTSFLLGTITSSYTPGEGTSAATENNTTGSSTALGFGGGIKYLSSFGLGFRVKLEYISRSIKFAQAVVNANEYTKSQAGPRFMFGASYRF